MTTHPATDLTKADTPKRAIFRSAFLLALLHAVVLAGGSLFFVAEEPPENIATPQQLAMAILKAESPLWARGWYHWDALWLVHLSKMGYRLEIFPDGTLWNSNVAFLPGIPAVASTLSRLGLNPWAGVLLFNVLADFLLMLGLGWLALDLTGSVRASLWAMLAMVAWPWHFFVITPYQEAAGLAAIVWSLWLIRQNRLIPAFLLALLASLFRLTAIGLYAGLIGGAALVALIDRSKWRESRGIIMASLGCFVGWQGLMLYFRQRFGDAQIGIKVQQAWGRDMPHLTGPIESLASAFQGVLTGSAWLDWFASVLVLLSLVFVRRELGLVWASGQFVLVAQALSTGMVVSSGRYMLTAIPFFITAGILADRRTRLVLPCLALSGVLQVMLLWRYGHGQFAG
ncbi:MAG: hypothetical protein ACKO5E_19625 [bacterium]